MRNLSNMASGKKHYNALDVIDRNAFGSILIISILVSLLSLIVPVAAQMLVNIVAFARSLPWLAAKVKKGDPILEMSDLDPNLVQRLQNRKKAIELRIQAAEAAVAAAYRMKNDKKNCFKKAFLPNDNMSLQKLSVPVIRLL